ncbi:unnamed protein product [Ostreobium quekettii]|uniref:Uncharacterized protein n=1 Tax=Ostreobium quekettii TaxID=121088 RepID=A0A8S1J077_9CHLO|nr:unnamed protein product [Ostreobium quekettii]
MPAMSAVSIITVTTNLCLIIPHFNPIRLIFRTLRTNIPNPTHNTAAPSSDTAALMYSRGRVELIPSIHPLNFSVRMATSAAKATSMDAYSTLNRSFNLRADIVCIDSNTSPSWPVAPWDFDCEPSPCNKLPSALLALDTPSSRPSVALEAVCPPSMAPLGAPQSASLWKLQLVQMRFSRVGVQNVTWSKWRRPGI